MAGQLSDQELQNLIQQAMASNKMPAGQTYVRFPDGTEHLVTRDENGNITDNGTVAAKQTYGKTVLRAFSDGTVRQVNVDPQGNETLGDILFSKPTNAAQAGELDARTKLYQDQAAQIELLSDTNKELAATKLARLQQQIADDTSLAPAKKAELDAQTNQLATKSQLNLSTANKNDSTANKLDAQTKALLEGTWASVQPQLQDAIDAHNKGLLNDQQFQDAVDRITQDAVTGLTTQQRASNQYNQDVLAKDQATNAVNQASNRATAASNYFDRALSTGEDIGVHGGSAKDIGSFLAGSLGVAPDFQASMGGAPVQGLQSAPTGNFTQQHFGQLLDLIKSGKVPPDANGDVVPNALKMLAGTGPSDVTPASDATMPSRPSINPVAAGVPAEVAPGGANLL